MANTYLTRTSDTATNVNKYTFSAWIKRSLLTSSFQPIFGGTGSTLANYHDSLFFSNSTDKFIYQGATSGSTEVNLQTSASYRDVSAWYHVVVAYDSTESTASDRVKIYINGVQETSFSTETYPAQNRGAYANGRDSSTITISKIQSDAVYFDGSMSHFHFIDGTAYDADTFGETDATTGIWKPKTAPSVTYGTNGFFLKFENSGAFGTDSSGNANNFTVNGTMTQTIDTPSNVFATFNPLYSGGAVYSNGNLTSTISLGSNKFGGVSTIGVSSGKWYAEFKALSDTTNYIAVGIYGNPQLASNDNEGVGKETDSIGYRSDGSKGIENTFSSYGASYTTNDIIGVALDLDSGTKTITFYKNGVSQGAITISLTPDEGFWFLSANSASASKSGIWSANFGNGYFGTTAISSAQNPDDGIGIFEYAVPTGYKALCTKSINAQEYD